MKGSKATIKRTIDVSAEEIPEIVATTLNGQAYSSIHINSRYKQATAREKAIEQYGQDRWDFEFRVFIKWRSIKKEKGTEKSEVTIEVTERQFPHQKHSCMKRCNRLWDELKLNSIDATTSNLEKSELYGSAQWGTYEELEEGGYYDEFNSGRLVLGKYHGKIITVPKHLTEEHALVCGPTGSGKTRTIFIPNLVRRLATSALVTEAASGDEPPSLYHKTAGYRASQGMQEIYYFNPSDLTSTRINPLDFVQTFDDANQICHLIMRNTRLSNSFSGDQVWEQSEAHLLNSLVLYVVGLREGKRAKEGDNANLAYIRMLLRDGPQEIGDLIMNSKIDLAIKEYNSFLKNTSPNFRFGVTSGLLVRLNPWVNRKVAALTEVTDFDEELLKSQLFTFYFAISTKKPQLRPVAALAFNYVFDLIQSPGFTYPVTLLLDELTNYGYIPELPDRLTHIRHQQIGAVLGIQHPIQLTKVYGDKDAVLLMTQPGTRVFFRPRDSRSALTVSQSLGNQTIQTRKVTPTGGIHEDERGRPLMDSSEILRLPKSKIVCMTPTTNPLIVNTFHPTEHDEFTKVSPPLRVARTVCDSLGESTTVTKFNTEKKYNRYGQQPTADDVESEEKHTRAWGDNEYSDNSDITW